MAQADGVVANGTGSAVRADINGQLAALFTNHSGSTAPATTFAFQTWADTNTNTLKLRNSANDGWIQLARLDGQFDAKTFNGNVTLNAQSDLRLADSDSSNWVAFQAPATVASNVTWTLPSADGTSGQTLQTNGSGTLSWSTPSASVDIISEGNTSAEVVDTGSDGHFKVVTEGAEALRVDASQRLLVGTSSGSGNSTAHFQGNSGASIGGAFVSLQRGAANPTSGTELATISFADNAPSQGARIQAFTDGNWAASDFPTRLTFSTTASGASSPTERMRIKSSGQISIDLPSNTTSRHIGITNSAGSIGWTFGNGITASARQFVVYDNEAGAARTVIDSSGNFKFNSGYGSAATAYGCRAFCVFDGASPGSPDITRNVSTIGDNGVGRFTINFSNNMPDANYAMAGSAGNASGTTTSGRCVSRDGSFTTSAAPIRVVTSSNDGATDDDYISVAFIR